MENQYRVTLEPIEEKHTDLIVRWRNNPRVYHNFIFSEPFTAQMHEKWLKEKVRTGQVVQFVICVKEENKEIGSVYFRDVDSVNATAEYGIFIGEDDYISKGYGTEVAKLALDYAFHELKLKKVFLRVFADNIGAIRSYERNGFRLMENESEIVEKDGEERKVIFMVCEPKK